MAARLGNIERHPDEDLGFWIKDWAVELEAPTFDAFSPEHLTHVPPEERQEQARAWIKVRVDRTITDIANWFGDAGQREDAALLGRALEDATRAYLLRIDTTTANALVRAIVALRGTPRDRSSTTSGAPRGTSGRPRGTWRSSSRRGGSADGRSS